jgi:hypothetical protein
VKYIRVCPANARDLAAKLHGQWLGGNDGFIDFRASNAHYHRAEMGDYVVWDADDVAIALKPVQFEANYNLEWSKP